MQIYVVLNCKYSLLRLGLTHPFLLEYPLHELLFNIADLKIFRKFQENYMWQSSYPICPNKHPWHLLNFETLRCGTCLKKKSLAYLPTRKLQICWIWALSLSRNFLKIFRTNFWKNTPGRMLLISCDCSSNIFSIKGLKNNTGGVLYWLLLPIHQKKFFKIAVL